MTERAVTSDLSPGSPTLERVIGRIVEAIAHNVIGPGELAQLRRLNVDDPNQPPFWKVMAAWVTPENPLPRHMETRWAIVLSGMARMAPDHHQLGRAVGDVLAQTDYHEMRLMRLLRSQGLGFADAVRRTCDFLAARAEPIDWVEFAALILTTDADKADDLRRKIARDYYGTIQRKETHS